jgi:hypothetical protein
VNLNPKPTCSYNHRKKCNICNRKTDGTISPLNAELNPISHLLALLEAHPILHVSRVRVKRKSWMSYFVLRIRRRVGHILFTSEKIVAIKESETLLKPRGQKISEHPLFAKFCTALP